MPTGMEIMPERAMDTAPACETIGHRRTSFECIRQVFQMQVAWCINYFNDGITPALRPASLAFIMFVSKPMKITRRAAIGGMAAAVPTLWLPRARAQSMAGRTIAAGDFRPDWQSLLQYQAPDWFRDAKFGIWAHWTAQCVPEQGDWYARQMYIQGHRAIQLPRAHYGHPSKFGFMEIDNLWKAEKWDPGDADGPLRQSRREILRLARQPSRQLRQLRFHAPRLEFRQRRAEERHRRHLGEDRAQARAALRRHQPFRPRLALVPDRLRLRPRRPAGRRPLRRLHAHQGRRQGQMVGRPRPAGALHRPDHGHARRPHHHRRTPTPGTSSNDRKWTEDPPANNPDFVEKLVSALPGPHRQIPARPALLRQHRNCRSARPASTSPPTSTTPTCEARRQARSRPQRPRASAATTSGTMVLDIERGQRRSHPAGSPWQTDTCIGDWHYNRAPVRAAPLQDRRGRSSRCWSTSSAKTATCC